MAVVKIPAAFFEPGKIEPWSVREVFNADWSIIPSGLAPGPGMNAFSVSVHAVKGLSQVLLDQYVNTDVDGLGTLSFYVRNRVPLESDGWFDVGIECFTEKRQLTVPYPNRDRIPWNRIKNGTWRTLNVDVFVPPATKRIRLYCNFLQRSEHKGEMAVTGFGIKLEPYIYIRKLLREYVLKTGKIRTYYYLADRVKGITLSIRGDKLAELGIGGDVGDLVFLRIDPIDNGGKRYDLKSSDGRKWVFVAPEDPNDIVYIAPEKKAPVAEFLGFVPSKSIWITEED